MSSDLWAWSVRRKRASRAENNVDLVCKDCGELDELAFLDLNFFEDLGRELADLDLLVERSKEEISFFLTLFFAKFVKFRKKRRQLFVDPLNSPVEFQIRQSRGTFREMASKRADWPVFRKKLFQLIHNWSKFRIIRSGCWLIYSQIWLYTQIINLHARPQDNPGFKSKVWSWKSN